MPSTESFGLRRPSRLGSRPGLAVILLATLTIALLFAAVTALLWELRQRDIDHALNETGSAARMLLDQTAEVMDAPDMALQGVKERLETGLGEQFALDSLPVHLLLGARVHGMRQVRSIYLLDANGMTLNSSSSYPAAPLSARDREYFRALAEGRVHGLYVGRAVQGLSGKGWTMHLARRVNDAHGHLRAVVVAAIDLNYFDRVFDHLTIDYVRPVALYLADGTLIASLPRRDGELGDIAEELKGVGLPQKAGEVHIITRHRPQGTPVHFALGRVEGYPLLAGVANDDVETLADWRESAAMITMSALLVATFIGVAAAALVAQLRRDARLSSALQEADERFGRTVESVMDAIVSVDDEQRIVIFNRAAERMFGVPAREMVGGSMGRLLPGPARAAHAAHMAQFLADPGEARRMAPRMEIRGLRADGSEFPIESTISKTRIRGRMQMTAVLRDISERRRAEEEMLALNQELRRLSVSLQSVREEERERISRELHDELGQQLTGIKLDLSFLVRRVREGRPVDPATLETMRQMLDAAIVSVRRISTELRPRILDELGFGEAVAWQAGEFTRRSGIDVALSLSAATLVKQPETATALFRIVQESLTNVARHAGARRVSVSLSNDAERLFLSIEDDGRGLPDAHRGGIGLVSMRERANALGGTFTVVARAGGGTVVSVSLPIEEGAAGREPAGGDAEAAAGDPGAAREVTE